MCNKKVDPLADISALLLRLKEDMSILNKSLGSNCCFLHTSCSLEYLNDSLELIICSGIDVCSIEFDRSNSRSSTSSNII